MQPSYMRGRATTLSPSSSYHGTTSTTSTSSTNSNSTSRSDVFGAGGSNTSPLTRRRSHTSASETGYHSWHGGGSGTADELGRSGGKRSRGSLASEILHHGHAADLTVLEESVQRFGDPSFARYLYAGRTNKGSIRLTWTSSLPFFRPAGFGLFVPVPEWGTHSGERFIMWMRQLGFREDAAGKVWGMACSFEHVRVRHRCEPCSLLGVSPSLSRAPSCPRDRRDTSSGSCASTGRSATTSFRRCPTTRTRPCCAPLTTAPRCVLARLDMRRRPCVRSHPGTPTLPPQPAHDSGGAGAWAGGGGTADASLPSTALSSQNSSMHSLPPTQSSGAATDGFRALSAHAHAQGRAPPAVPSFHAHLRPGVLQSDSNDDFSPRSRAASPAGFFGEGTPLHAYGALSPAPAATRQRHFFGDAASGPLATVREGREHNPHGLGNRNMCSQSEAGLGAGPLAEAEERRLGETMDGLALGKARHLRRSLRSSCDSGDDCRDGHCSR